MTLSIATQIQAGELVEAGEMELHHSSEILSVAVSPSGDLLAHGDADGGVVVRLSSCLQCYHMAADYLLSLQIRSARDNLKPLRLAKTGGAVTAIVFHTTEENTVITGSLNGYIDIWTFMESVRSRSLSHLTGSLAGAGGRQALDSTGSWVHNDDCRQRVWHEACRRF